MSLWEYKVITSGKGGFATPALLEKFLNDLGRDEWEIVEFRSLPDNALAFTGLARRSTQRDWTLEDAAAAAAKVEAEKLRAEFVAKFQAATSNGPAIEEKSASFLEEKSAPDDGFRKPVDTSRDSDPDAPEEDSSEKDEWDQLASEDELPSFFDALKPHMRRNQRGPGMSVGTDYLAKKWGLAEEDIKGALVECGMQIPADENAKPAYVEYDGDLFWVNINRRGEVWINTREKPRPVFRIVHAAKVAPETTEEPKAEGTAPRPDENVRKTEDVAEPTDRRRNPPAQPKAEAPKAKPEAAVAAQPGAPLPEGSALLDKVRPLMRRNRRGPGGSGSASFLARALKCTEADLLAGFAGLGLILPAAPADKPVEVEISGDIWWLNQDSRGGFWINGREKRPGEKVGSAGATTDATTDTTSGAPVAATDAPSAADAPANADAAGMTENAGEARSGSIAAAPVEKADTAPVETNAAAGAENVLGAVRLRLKGTKTGSFAGKVDRVAGELSKPADELTAALLGAGLKIPEKPREKPVFVEYAGEIYWFNRNPKGELWVNAKASKFSDQGDGAGRDAAGGDEGGRKPARRGGRSRKGSPDTPDAAPAA